MNTAFLGLGAIGRPMAARIAKRSELTVWNRTGAVAAEFAATVPCRVAPTPAAAVRDADVVLICLSTSQDVASIMAGPDGVLAGIRPGALLLDCTSGDPKTARALAAQLAAADVAYADCPVSGGPGGAEAGVLTVMVGADTPAVFDRAKPVLEAFGKLVVHLGPVGAGNTVKAVNQALLAANILTLAEALPAMVKAGVPARAGIEVLNASSGRSFVSESLVPPRVLTGAWPRLFRLALMDKDIGIALDLVSQLGLEAPILAHVRRATAELRAALGEQADYLDPIRVGEQKAGVEVRG